jgi:hypothetical protein
VGSLLHRDRLSLLHGLTHAYASIICATIYTKYFALHFATRRTPVTSRSPRTLLQISSNTYSSTTFLRRHFSDTFQRHFSRIQFTTAKVFCTVNYCTLLGCGSGECRRVRMGERSQDGGTRSGDPGVWLISFFSQCTSTSLFPRCNSAGNNSSSFLFNIGSCECAHLASYVKLNDFVLATIRSCSVLKEITLASNVYGDLKLFTLADYTVGLTGMVCNRVQQFCSILDDEGS